MMTWKAIRPWLVVALVAALSAVATRYGLPVPKEVVTEVVEKIVPVQAPLEPAPVSEPVYFCGRVESVLDNAFTAKPWPDKKIKWSLDTAQFVGPLSRPQILEAFQAAWLSWAANIGIQPTFVENAAEAHVRIKFGDYDGSGKVLAWSELSDGTMTPKHQLYDRAERWGIFSGPGSGIDLVRVAAHEIGHVLGLVHDDGSGQALMDPVYSNKLRFPTERDIGRALALGYPPAPKDPGMPPEIKLTVPVTLDVGAVVDALRKAGYGVTEPKK